MNKITVWIKKHHDRKARYERPIHDITWYDRFDRITDMIDDVIIDLLLIGLIIYFLF